MVVADERDELHGADVPEPPLDGRVALVPDAPRPAELLRERVDGRGGRVLPESRGVRRFSRLGGALSRRA